MSSQDYIYCKEQNCKDKCSLWCIKDAQDYDVLLPRLKSFKDSLTPQQKELYRGLFRDFPRFDEYIHNEIKQELERGCE